MILINIILILLLILKAYSSANNHNSEQLAALIINVADKDGNLLSDNIFNVNSDNFEDFSITSDNNGNSNCNLLKLGSYLQNQQNRDITIIDIIPTLSVDYIKMILVKGNRELNNPIQNYNPSDIEILDRINLEFKTLFKLSIKVLNGKYLDIILWMK